MKLYRIRRKSDGKFFTQFWGAPIPKNATFGPSGTFWKQIDTAVKNAKYLCATEYTYHGDTYPWGPNGMRKFSNATASFDFTLLENYEIVITDVTVNNETAVPAADYFKQEAA